MWVDAEKGHEVKEVGWKGEMMEDGEEGVRLVGGALFVERVQRGTLQRGVLVAGVCCVI
jgi:hypothetical protein